MEKAFNLYGDKPVATKTGCGTEIAAVRQDELDSACLAFAQEAVRRFPGCWALDLGGGVGAQSKRLAAVGMNVVLVDLSPVGAAAVQTAGPGRGAVQFWQKDAREISHEMWPRPLHVVYSQRALGYLRYEETQILLRDLAKSASPGAGFFLSSGGLETEYGRTYPDYAKPVAARFAELAEDMAEKHNIHAPQCLYRPDELAALLQSAGLKVERAWASPFGNPKVIAAKP